MIILILFALGLSIPTSPDMLNNTSIFSAGLQKKCESQLPASSTSYASLAALICGVNLPSSQEKQNLLRTSLIHAYVVSGSHLLLVDQVFSILKIPGIVRFLFLALYSLLVGWQPPVVRALTGWGLRKSHQRLRLNIPRDFVLALAGMACLILFPAWWRSMSLILSWCAALALCLPSALGVRGDFQKIFYAQLSLFVLMSFPLWGWGNLHPLGLIFNLLLLPAISFILMPLGILALFFDFALPTFEKAEFLFHWILAAGAEPVVFGKSSPLPQGAMWLWIGAWHLGIHFIRLYRRQGQDLA